MTKQCKEVLDACDFNVSDVKLIETFVAKCSTKQIINLVWKKDPGGEHQAEWFVPFFTNGYLKSKNEVICSFSDEFWLAYDWFSQCISEFSVFDFPLIDDMSKDTQRMKKAFGKSRVQSLAYIHKVFIGIESTKSYNNNIGMVDFSITSGVVKTKEY